MDFLEHEMFKSAALRLRGIPIGSQQQGGNRPHAAVKKADAFVSVEDGEYPVFGAVVR